MHKLSGALIECTKEERVHGYEACDRVCPVLGCRRLNTLIDPAEYFYRSDQHYPVYSGRI